MAPIRAPLLIVDPVDSDLTQLPGAVTFRDPARPPDARRARFVPYDPGDLDAIDRVYRWAFTTFPRYVWADEAGYIAPARSTSAGVRTLIAQGRKRSIGHLACHTRPREVDPGLISNAAHVFVFDIPNPDDRRRVAELSGVPPATLDAELRRLPEFGFLWYDQRLNRLTAIDPLPA